jgi:two-component system, OmpR family, KDP operon response regulator KdpE
MSLVVLASSDAAVRERVLRFLHGDEFDVIEADSKLLTFRLLFERDPVAIVVDLCLEQAAGSEFVQVLRAASDLAIVAIARGGDASATITALEAGADDVVRTDTPRDEFLARLRAAVRRSQRAPRRQAEATRGRVVVTGDLRLDRSARIVTKGGTRVALTRTEYRLIDALAERLGEVVSHRVLLSTVWGEQFIDDTHYLRVYIGYLRQKLEENPRRPRYLVSERGVGYRLVRHPAGPEAGQDVPPAGKLA